LKKRKVVVNGRGGGDTKGGKGKPICFCDGPRKPVKGGGVNGNRSQ